LIILSPYSEYRYRNWLKTLGDVILSLIVVIPDINHLVLQFLKFKSRKISNQLPINLVLSKTIDATSDGRLGKIRYLIGSAILDWNISKSWIMEVPTPVPTLYTPEELKSLKECVIRNAASSIYI
jgi:hypothetical protein